MFMYMSDMLHMRYLVGVGWNTFTVVRDIRTI